MQTITFRRSSRATDRTTIPRFSSRSEEHTSELQSRFDLVCRLLLEKKKQQFDVLAIDAFSSDAIPMHMLTSEALAVYRKHMTPGGIIAFHVTTRCLDFHTIVARIGE